MRTDEERIKICQDSSPGADRQTPESIYTVRDIAAEWKLSIDTIQRLFAPEPDVFVIARARKKTLRIPESVKQRVWRRMSNVKR